MNGKQAKKIRQYVRREIFKNLSMIKAKPKFIPAFFYRFLLRRLIDWGKMRNVLIDNGKI